MNYFIKGLYRHLIKIHPFIFFGLLSLITLNWFNGHQFIFGIDTIFPINRDFLSEYTYIWSNKVSYGGEDIFKLPVIFPYVFILWIVSYVLNYNNWEIIQRVIIYFLFFSGGVGTYYLSKLSYSKLSVLSHLIAGTFYLFNFYVLYLITPLPIYLLFSYFMFPSVFAIFIYVIKNIERINSFNAGLLFIIGYLLIGTSYATTPYIILHLGVIFLYCLYFVIKKEYSVKIAFKTYSLFILVFLILSAFWIFPFINTEKTQFTNIISSIDEGFSSYKLNSTDISDIFLLQGYFGLNESYNGTAFYKWYSVYKAYYMIVPGIILLLLTFLPLFLNHEIQSNKDKSNFRTYLFFILLLMVFIFFITIIHFAYPDPFIFILNKLNFFSFFRTAYQRFTGFVALSMALALAFSFDFVVNRLRSYLPRLLNIIPLVYFLLIFIYVWPMFSKDIFSANDIFPSKSINIPNEYFEVSKYLDEQNKDKGVLLLPFNKLGLYSLIWNKGEDGYEGLHPFLLTGKFRLVNSEILGFSVGDLIEKYVHNITISSKDLARAFNIGYIIIHKDLNTKTSYNNSWWIGTELENLQNKITTDNCLYKQLENDYMILYKISDECQTSKIALFKKSDVIKLNSDKAYINASTIALGAYDANLFINCTDKSSSCRDGNNQIIKGEEVIDYESIFRDHSNLTLPNTSAKPGTFKYRLANIKESIIEYFSSKNQQEKANINIWFLAKRMQELVNWDLDKNVKHNLISVINTKKDYLLNYFKQIDQEDRNESYYDTLDKLIYYIDDSIKNSKSDDNTGLLIKIKDDFRKLYDYSASCGESVCYKFIIRKDNEFSLKNIIEDDSVRYYLDNKQIDPKSKVKLSEGIHFIYLKSTLNNGISLPAIEKNVEMAPTQVYSRVYETISEVDLPIWNTNEIYEFSFDYNATNGKLILSVDDRNVDYSSISVFSELYKQSGQSYLTINDRVVSVLEEDLSNNDSKRLKFILSPGKLSKSKGQLRFVYVFNKPHKNGSVSIKNILLRKLPNKEPLLYKTGLENYSNSIKVENFTRINPNFYIINLENTDTSGLILNLKERFSKGWYVYTKQDYSFLDNIKYYSIKLGALLLNQQIYPYGYKRLNLPHYQTNAIDNGWDIGSIHEPVRNNEIVIYFSPQRNLYIGLLISVISLFILLVCLKILSKKQKI